MSKKEEAKASKLLKAKFSKAAENIKHALLEACQNGDLETVQRIVELVTSQDTLSPFQKHGVKIGIDMPDATSGNSALIVAICAKDVEAKTRNQIVSLLLEFGADPNLKNKYKQTPLMVAARAGDKKSVCNLLSHDAKPNAQDGEKNTPLTIAAVNGDSFIVRELIDRNATLNHRNDSYETALILAAGRGNKKVVDRLLDEENINLDIQNEYGNTALMRAISQRNPDIAKILLKAGADPNVINSNGRTALIHAARKQDLDSVKALLEVGAKTSVVSGHPTEGTALDIALSTSQTNYPIARAILDNTYDPIPLEAIEKYLVNEFLEYPPETVEMLWQYVAVEEYSVTNPEDGAVINELRGAGFWPGLD